MEAHRPRIMYCTLLSTVTYVPSSLITVDERGFLPFPFFLRNSFFFFTPLSFSFISLFTSFVPLSSTPFCLIFPSFFHPYFRSLFHPFSSILSFPCSNGNHRFKEQLASNKHAEL
jgi:hypothetical protein